MYGIFPQTLVDFFGINVGKYSSLMDGTGVRGLSFGCRQDSDAVHVCLPSFREFHGCHAPEGAMWTIGHPNSVVARIQNAFSMSSPF